MKKTALIILTILILTLTACGGASNTPQVDPNQLSDTSENALPLPTQLLIGTFRLEGTDLAITPKQAGELIPLWQVYQELSTSDTAAQAEIDALIEQVQETLTSDQMNAIKAMNLTQQDIFTLMQEQGVAGQGGRTFTQGGSGTGGGEAFPVPPSGEGGQTFISPGGGPGGFGGGQGQSLSPEQIATAQARRSEGGGDSRLVGTPAPLIEALIQFLQKKAAS